MSTRFGIMSRFCVIGSILIAMLFAGRVSAATYYVSPSGNDSDPGTLSKPWGTFAGSVNRLAAGDTLMARGGIYRESNISVTVAGTATSPITIRNYPGETPVIDGAPQEYQTIGNTSWVLHDAAKHIYRSVNTYSGSITTYCGGKYQYNGQTYSLIPYKLCAFKPQTEPAQYIKGYDYLQSTDCNWNWNVARYMGPGVTYGKDGDSYIYIRLDPTTADSMHNIITPNEPDIAHLDPSTLSISIIWNNHGFSPAATSAYIVLDGINLANHWAGVRGWMANWTIRNLTITPGVSGILANDTSHHILVDRVVFNMFVPDWVAWGDIKGGEAAANAFQGSCIGGSQVSDLEVRNCLFNKAFDGIDIISQQGDPSRLNVHHNTSLGNKDDFFEIGSHSDNVEVAYNYIKGSGPAHAGAGNAVYPGTKYIHHNIIDASELMLLFRYDPQNLRQTYEKAWQSHIAFESHAGQLLPDGDPWKIYHNTVVLGNKRAPANNYSIGQCSWPARVVNQTSAKHEVFNNVFNELHNNDQTYMPENVSFANYNHWMAYQWQLFYADKEAYDGNVYYRSPGGTGTAVFFATIFYDAANSASHNYASLAAWRNSTSQGLYMTSGPPGNYPGGWEYCGSDADPGLDRLAAGDYRPTLSPAADQYGKDLSGMSWPGAANVPWRGAMPKLPADILANLRGYWKFNEGAPNTTVADSSGCNHPGTLTSGPVWISKTLMPAWVRDETDYALCFDDNVANVSVANHADFNFGSAIDFSIAAWIRVDVAGAGGYVVFKGAIGRGGKRYLLQVKTTTGLLNLNMDDDINERAVNSTIRVDDGLWHHVAATVDRDGYTKLYIDGVYNTQSALTGMASIDDTSKPLTIGESFPGAIDDVRVYASILSSDDIKALYQRGCTIGRNQ